MNSRPGPPRWLLGGLVIISSVYFQMNPAIRFTKPATGPLTGMEIFANLLLGAVVATFAVIALRAITKAMEMRK
jgi:hypothetical protein